MRVTVILLLRRLLRSMTLQPQESEVVILCLLAHLLRKGKDSDVVQELPMCP